MSSRSLISALKYSLDTRKLCSKFESIKVWNQVSHAPNSDDSSLNVPVFTLSLTSEFHSLNSIHDSLLAYAFWDFSYLALSLDSSDYLFLIHLFGFACSLTDTISDIYYSNEYSLVENVMNEVR